jgi:DNA-binding transcriptional LysR family regulator
VVLDIVVDDSLSDIVAGHFDAGIRVGKRLEKDMTVVRLTPDVKIIVAASPDYLARNGVPTAPLDLRRHACINWRLPGRDGISRWEFEKRGKKVEIAVDGPLIANRQDVGVAAALQGLGILYAYDDDGVVQAMEQGQLERILADWSPVRPGLYLYYSNRRHPQPALRAFIDSLLGRDGPVSKRRART